MAWLDFLDKNAELHSSKVALEYLPTGESFTHFELKETVDLWANYFLKLGFKKGDRLAYLSMNSLEHVIFLLALSRIGGILVPLNFRLSKGELLSQVDFLKPKLCVYGKNFQDVFEGVQYFNSTKDFKNSEDFETIGMELNDLKNQFYEFSQNIKSHIRPNDSDVFNFQKNQPDSFDPALMLFTSGSTGTPKGVLFHSLMLETNMRETATLWKLKSSDQTIVETPFFHTGGFNVLCLPLLGLGGTVRLAQNFQVDQLLNLIHEGKVTAYFGVPTMFQMIIEHPKFLETSFKSLRFCVSGGAPASVSMIEKIQKNGVKFIQGFGLTEVGPNCFLLDEENSLRKIGSIGRPMPHSLVKVVDANGNKVGVNTPGELLIGGDHLALGYFQNEDLFQSSISIDLVSNQKYFKTGDLVRVDEEGFFYVVGRIKDMYISGGENVYPLEVESAILTHESIEECKVVPVHDEKWGEVGFLFYRAAKSCQINLSTIKEFLIPKLSKYKHPHYAVQLEEFPLLPNGKIDKLTLVELAKSRVQS